MTRKNLSGNFCRRAVAVGLLVLAGQLGRATANTLTTLYPFTGGQDGSQPYGGVILGGDGNLYGTTHVGGGNGAGTVFRLSTAGAFTLMYGFSGGADGGQPHGGLVLGSDSNFYGTTYLGGTSGTGTVFKITTAGALTTLHNFTGGVDGGQPYWGLVQGSDGNFYGTTYDGGAYGLGTVFAISAAGLVTTLHSFAGGNDGANPSAGLVQGSDGLFYGTTYTQGSGGAGTIFKITTAGTLTTFHSFNGNQNGGNPVAGLVQGSDGLFYGTTYAGGADGFGTLFKITTAGLLTTLHTFTDGNDGGNPAAPLIQGSDGNFYGTTYTGGPGGAGTVFKTTPAGALTTLYSFTGGTDGGGPLAGVTAGSFTNYYGTTSAGGSFNDGTVFNLIVPCTYSLSSAVVSLPGLAATGTFTVSASSSNCVWTATNNVNWITITSGSTSAGNGTVAYSVAANTNTNSRVGTITAAGRIFTVEQQGLVFGKYMLGTYNGLILQTNAVTAANSGSLTLVLTKTGSFVANLAVGSTRTAFVGKFDPLGNATNTVLRHNQNSLQILLQLAAVSNGTDLITGSVSDTNTFTSPVLANLAVFTAANPCPWAGTYSFVLPPADGSDPTVPQGYGYGTLAVTTAGSGHLAGTLGDGTAINATVPVSGYGTWPFYNSLYVNQGACLGWVTFGTSHTIGATLEWLKPAAPRSRVYTNAFTTVLMLDGAKYVSPTLGGPVVAGAWQVTLSGGNLASNIVKSVLVSTQGVATVTVPGADKLSLRLVPTTGAFSGSFVLPVTKRPVTFRGLLLQQPFEAGGGYFLGTNATGSVVLTP